MTYQSCDDGLGCSAATEAHVYAREGMETLKVVMEPTVILMVLHQLGLSSVDSSSTKTICHKESGSFIPGLGGSRPDRAI